ncbi:MAG: DNA polymerase III subunit gamma/tau [Christensenellaceae bacterium]|jgi:DNA polymerase-3 subunit gamma/tau|nr:DNA polymerase III subunit gamma/tau [Christensenellaceae bacterium]
MNEISLYRRYRPKNWEGVIGQDHIVKTLINQINRGQVNHAYLFTGTRGTGKTSTAKIFSRAINCLSPINGSPCGACAVCTNLDSASNISVMEMDAASNNGVDEIRDIRDSVLYPPPVGKYKVYIVDEVHMLTTAAFNAFLKTLEEPPDYVVFILATTEVHKLPQTIISRCMRFDFRLVPQQTLSNHLKSIFTKEKYRCDKESLDLIALHAAGSVRDMLSLADMCMSYAPDGLKLADTTSVLGTSDFSVMLKLSKAILFGDYPGVLQLSRSLVANGKSISISARDLTSFFNEIVTFKNVSGYEGNFNKEQVKELTEFVKSPKFDNTRLSKSIEIFSSLENKLRYSSQPHILFDAALINATDMTVDESTVGINSSLRTLRAELEEMKKQLDNFKSNPSLFTIATEPTNNILANDSSNSLKHTQDVTISTPSLSTSVLDDLPIILKDVEHNDELPFKLPFDAQSSADTDIKLASLKTVDDKLQFGNEESNAISPAVSSQVIPSEINVDYIDEFFDMISLPKSTEKIDWPGDKGTNEKPSVVLLWFLNLLKTTYGTSVDAMTKILLRGLILHFKLTLAMPCAVTSIFYSDSPPKVEIKNNNVFSLTFNSDALLTDYNIKTIHNYVTAFNAKCGTKYKANTTILTHY